DPRSSDLRAAAARDVALGRRVPAVAIAATRRPHRLHRHRVLPTARLRRSPVRAVPERPEPGGHLPNTVAGPPARHGLPGQGRLEPDRLWWARHPHRRDPRRTRLHADRDHVRFHRGGRRGQGRLDDPRDHRRGPHASEAHPAHRRRGDPATDRLPVPRGAAGRAPMVEPAPADPVPGPLLEGARLCRSRALAGPRDRPHRVPRDPADDAKLHRHPLHLRDDRSDVRAGLHRDPWPGPGLGIELGHHAVLRAGPGSALLPRQHLVHPQSDPRDLAGAAIACVVRIRARGHLQPAATRLRLTAVPVLSVRDLSIDYITRKGPVHAVRDVSFELEKSETLAIIGESGSGKTTLAVGLIRLSPRGTKVTKGEILYTKNGLTTDIRTLDDDDLREYRWAEAAMVFQAALNS